jgi:hypothetical protein
MGGLTQAVNSLAQNLSDSSRVLNTAFVELPRVYVDTDLQVLGGSTINVAAGGNLQAALDAAVAGDTIVLEAGATFTGNFTIGAKTGYVYVKSANFAVAAGTRVSQANESSMAKIQSGNASPAIQAGSAAKYWRFIGVEIRNTRTDLDCTRLVSLQPATAPTAAASFPSYIIFDRCSIHGNPGDKVRLGIRFGGAHQAVIDSIIYDIRQPGFDTQCISDSQGSGPYKIVNNYLEAASENIAFGGSDPWVSGVWPSDIEIKRNHLFKQLWWAGVPEDSLGRKPRIKNLLELKAGRRVLIEGNILENNWVSAQTGFALVMTPVAFPNITASGEPAIQDVMVRNNRILNSPKALNTLGTGAVGATSDGTRATIRRHAYINNYWELTGEARLIQAISDTERMAWHRNTVKVSGVSSTALFIGPNVGTDNEFSYNIIRADNYPVYTNLPISTQANWEAAFLPTASVAGRVVGNIFYGPTTRFVGSGNSFVSTYEAAIALNTAGADQAAIQAAIDGIAAGTTPVPNPGDPADPGPVIPPVNPPTPDPNPTPLPPTTNLTPYSRDWILARVAQELNAI